MWVVQNEPCIKCIYKYSLESSVFLSSYKTSKLKQVYRKSYCKACLISLTSMELIAIFSQFTVMELPFPSADTLTVTRTCVPPEMVRPANLYMDTPSETHATPMFETAAASFTFEHTCSPVASLDEMSSFPELSFKPVSFPAKRMYVCEWVSEPVSYEGNMQKQPQLLTSSNIPCLVRKSASVMGQPCSNSPTGALMLTGNLLFCVLKWQAETFSSYKPLEGIWFGFLCYWKLHNGGARITWNRPIQDKSSFVYLSLVVRSMLTKFVF